MKRIMLFFSLLLGFVLQGWAQPPVESRPLNASELREKPWFYSMEEALANPAEVYKLSLSEQKLKEVPLEIAQFTNLQVLNLSSCKLKALPDTIRVLHHLEMLSLFDNKIKALPMGFRELKNLEVLYLGKNKLTEIPIWIGGMGRLRRLDVSRNPITPLELMYIKQMMPKVELTY